MLKIGEFSKLAKSTVKTLRYYDEVNLLKPVFVDDNGYRYYEIEQLNDLVMIVELRKLDLPIVEINKIIKSNQKEKVLENHLQFLLQEYTKKQQQISLIKKYIAKAKKGEFMQRYEAKEIVVPKNIVYYKHGIIDSMQNIFDFVLSAGAEVKQHNPNLQCKDYCYITYTAKEYKEKDVELEYVEAVKDFGKESESIKFRRDPEIKAISVEHRGSYANLSQAYAYALNYVKEKGFEIAGPIREVYIHGCWDEQDENNYLTEIQIPIK
ncbi:MAG: MerR family transcriptional regulator [Christensenellales bacterium]